MKISIPLSSRLLILCGIIIMSFAPLLAQDDSTSDFSYEINRVQKYVSISPTQLDDATVLSDLNHYYKADWVKEYKAVEMILTTNGQKKKLNSINNKLTTEQKQAIRSADLGTDIEVLVYYLPKNNLSSSKIFEMDFSFRIDPEQEAIYTGGQDLFDQYIENTILENVTIKDVSQHQVAAVKFTIDEDGNVVDANIAQASKNKDADVFLLKTICEMPKWESAQYADGTKTKQEFVFTIGDHYSCTLNMLDIKSEFPPSTQQDR